MRSALDRPDLSGGGPNAAILGLWIRLDTRSGPPSGSVAGPSFVPARPGPRRSAGRVLGDEEALGGDAALAVRPDRADRADLAAVHGDLAGGDRQRPEERRQAGW